VPVAIVTMADPEINRRRLAQDLHVRFGLTAAEAGLAAEIVKGDGREAAAKRRGISVATARAQLSSILKRPGRTAKPNSSISCSNSPAKEAQKNGALTASHHPVVISRTTDF